MSENGEHVSITGGRRKNVGKLRVDLVPTSLVTGVAAVLTIGAEKYAPRNWEKGLEFSNPYSSLMRHLLAWSNGEDYDPETGRLHMEHIACNAAFLIEYHRRIAEGTLTPKLDDRQKYLEHDPKPTDQGAASVREALREMHRRGMQEQDARRRLDEYVAKKLAENPDAVVIQDEIIMPNYESERYSKR